MIQSVDEPMIPQESVSDSIPRTREFFSESSPLKLAANFGGRPYEKRPQQERMAIAVAEALQKNRNLCVEAPTGVGKSFAYLVPAIYHALAMHKPVLVTTETINLQEQLVNKDLPLLHNLIDREFTYVLAKGRSNYLCRRRLALTGGDYREELLPLASMKSDLEQLRDWAKNTKDGSKSEVPFRLDNQLWASVCCETSNCRGPKCDFYHTCFYWKNRHVWDKADIVVTNHALFFTDLKIREIEQQENCPLPEYCAVVFDEAHSLEDIASNHLGIHVQSGQLRYLLNRLFNPITARGLLMKPGEDSLSIRGQITTAHEALTHFFDQFDPALEKSPEQTFRVMKPGMYDDPFSPRLQDLERILKDYIAEQEDTSFRMELTSQLERCTAAREEIGSFLQMDFAEHVYWIEGHKAALGRGKQTELASAPLNVSELLQKILFSAGKPIILTSATLAVRETLSYYAQRVGFYRGDGLILDSPFDYQKQVKLYLAKTMPAPTEQAFNNAAADQILKFVTKTNGAAFVLFTSYGMLKYCADRLGNIFRAKGFNLLVHGDSLSRSAMLSEFKKTKHSVIFGATSFWTGVDVPGEALSNVIITKLPFAVPTHPVIAARCERVRELGGEPFRDYTIPDAVLKFRQGIGRLIRSKTDTGIIVVLDPRLISKYYGRIFLNSIPSCPVEYF